MIHIQQNVINSILLLQIFETNDDQNNEVKGPSSYQQFKKLSFSVKDNTKLTLRIYTKEFYAKNQDIVQLELKRLMQNNEKQNVDIIINTEIETNEQKPKKNVVDLTNDSDSNEDGNNIIRLTSMGGHGPFQVINNNKRKRNEAQQLEYVFI